MTTELNTMTEKLAHSLSPSLEVYQVIHLSDEIENTQMIDEINVQSTLNARKSVYSKKVLKAIGKMKAGTFGICEECGCQISASRLSARPTAELCVDCKEEKEEAEAKCQKNKSRYGTTMNLMVA